MVLMFEEGAFLLTPERSIVLCLRELETSVNSFPFSVCLRCRFVRFRGVFSTALSTWFFELALVRLVIAIYLRPTGTVLVCGYENITRDKSDCESKMKINHLRTGAAASSSETSAAPAWIDLFLLSRAI
jgi:hypothetical protein